MRRLLVLAVLAVPLAATAETTPVPYLLTHEGRLVDAQDRPVNDAVEMTFQIHETDNSALRQPLWQDTMTVQVGDGRYGVVLGDTARGATKPLDLTVLTKPELFLSVSIDGTELLPRQRLTSAVYALRAARAAAAESVLPDGVDTDALADGAVTLVKLAQVDGKVVGLNADLLDGLEASAFAPAAIEAKVDAIKESTDGLAALATEVAAVKANTDSLEATVDGVKASTDGLAALATKVGTIESNTAGVQETADAIKAKTETIPTLATAEAVTTLTQKVDKLLEMLAPTSCPSGMTLVGGAGNRGAFCIDNARQTNSGNDDDFAVASRSCSQRGLHLCTYDQWSEACGTNGLNLLDGWQWVAATAGTNGVDRGSPNNYGLRPILGSSSCWNSNWGWGGFGSRSTHGWRCCR